MGPIKIISMDQFFLAIHDISDKLAQTYNLDVGAFFWIYVTSIGPIYVGVFLILRGSTRKLTWRDIFKFQLGDGFQFTNQTWLGLAIHVFGWLMPYLYIFVYGKNLPAWSYVVVIIIVGISFLTLIKKMNHRKKKVITQGLDIVKMTMINDSVKGDILWEIYDKTFEPVNEISPCRQSLDRDHFFEILTNLTVTKYLLIKEGVGIIGLALITNDLKNTQWISPDYFRVNFPSEYQKNLVYYFMGIAIKNEFRGNRYSILLIERVIDDLPKEAIMGFDHSKNINPMLHHFTQIVRQAQEIKRKHIDRQHYHIVSRK